MQLEMEESLSPLNVKSGVWWKLVVLLWVGISAAQAQQSYVNNHQLDCDNDFNETNGFVCNGRSSSCVSYLTFRSASPYDSPPTIAYLLNSKAAQIAEINQVSDIDQIPKDTVLIVPVNCSCSGNFSQHNTSYTLKHSSETYFSLANNTYQGLTTCQAMKAQNPYYYRNLSVGMDLVVPLMCACPTPRQTAAGFNYLLSYLVTWGNSISDIAQFFGVNDTQSIYEANRLSPDQIIFPFTPILVPLRNPPKKIEITISSPPAPPPQPPLVPPAGDGNSSKKWAFIGAGIGAALLVLLASFGIMFCLLSRRSGKDKPVLRSGEVIKPSGFVEDKASGSVSSEGVRFALESLTVYKYEELQKATGFFGEANRIKGCVYRGSFKGDDAAVKMMKGNVTEEMNILKQINHSNVIRLSGFCIHEGNTYLVYEYAENGSLSDWLHSDCPSSPGMGWKQRVQIAYDVADALNYLHNYINPPCIHKNLKSSNILLDANMRAKVANFGLARRLENEEGGGGGLQLTRHVVGTQGYLAPEYIENGLITPNMDAFAFGVVILELLSGKEAAPSHKNESGKLLSVSVKEVLEGDNVRDKLRCFIDPSLAHGYPFDLAFSMAQLAKSCVATDLNARPTMSNIFVILSKILSSSLDWDPSDDFQASGSISQGR